MSSGDLKRQLEKLWAAVPPPLVPLSELPVEEWVTEEIEGTLPVATLENSTDEEVFYKWLEELPKRLLNGLEERFLEATAGPWSFDELDQLLPEELNVRAVDALPPNIECWWQLWVENAGAREKRRQWVAEIQRRYPTGPRTRTNGYGWWFSVQEEYRRLAEKYHGFKDEWQDFYERWKDETTPGTPMSDELRGEFLRVCFAQTDFSCCHLR
ncbi:MAG: hypothetical protein LC751_04030 [Actinobacteria bacterium]|nr:hypothetical protein [Actinomycetota bacterium]